ncbi:hypothetical protein Hanom_Chr16g01446941 [Helianthus anomalus]
MSRSKYLVLRYKLHVKFYHQFCCAPFHTKKFMYFIDTNIDIIWFSVYLRWYNKLQANSSQFFILHRSF